MSCPGMSVPLEQERRRRMASVWHSDLPAVHEEARARRVVAGRLAPPKQHWRRGWGLAVAAAAIVLVVVGAWASEKLYSRGSEAAPALQAPAPSSTVSANHCQPPAATAPLSVAMPSSSAAAVASVPPSNPVQGFTSTPRASAPEPAIAPSQPAPIASEPAPAASTRARSAWVRAADAMQRGDSEAADRALAELASGEDAIERDAASLARAQNWLASGQRERARPVLQRLAASGATPWIRVRAAELLAEEKR